MRPGETVRYGCPECKIVFDIRIAPVSEWLEQFDENDYDEPMPAQRLERCPFCSLGELDVLKVTRGEIRSKPLPGEILPRHWDRPGHN